MANQDVVVLGAGVGGIGTSLALASSGVRAHLIEREADIGGHAATYCCKALDTCQQCGACLVPERVEAVRTHPLIDVMTETTVTGVSGSAGGFHVATATAGGSGSVDAGAIVLATGIDPFDARRKAHLGFKQAANVMTGLELEEQWRRDGAVRVPSSGQAPTSVAFIQCVGSRDESIGHGYCSRVCCKYAMRMGMLMRQRYPELAVTVFYMDIQSCGKEYDRFSQRCRKEIRFVPAIPVGVEQVNGQVRVRHEDPGVGHLTRETFDLVVLSIGMEPRADAADVADLFGVETDATGFFATPAADELHRSTVPGVFLAGTCHGPMTIAESIAHGQGAAAGVMRFLGARA